MSRAPNVSPNVSEQNSPLFRWLSKLDYNPLTGILRWNCLADLDLAGVPAGTVTKRGYRVISLGGVKYMAHRLAWLIHYGFWPSRQVDHRNGLKDDNRIENLREATAPQNRSNVAKQRNNTSGYKGVTFHPRQPKKPWQARIMKKGRRVIVGSFATAEEAAAAYDQAARLKHGEFARMNGPALDEATAAQVRRKRFKGIAWIERGGRVVWKASIYSAGRSRFLGYHPTPQAAAEAYDDAHVEIHGRGSTSGGSLNLPILQLFKGCIAF